MRLEIADQASGSHVSKAERAAAIAVIHSFGMHQAAKRPERFFRLDPVREPDADQAIAEANCGGALYRVSIESRALSFLRCEQLI